MLFIAIRISLSLYLSSMTVLGDEPQCAKACISCKPLMVVLTFQWRVLPYQETFLIYLISSVG